MSRLLAAIMALLLVSPLTSADGVPFRAHRAPNITVQEWEAYRVQVVAAYGKTESIRPANREVLYFDATTGTQYIFTLVGHSAHPAVISRRTRSWGGANYLVQVGAYAGSGKEHQNWFNRYRLEPLPPIPTSARELYNWQ